MKRNLERGIFTVTPLPLVTASVLHPEMFEATHFGLLPNSDGLQPSSILVPSRNGLLPNSDGLQPSSVHLALQKRKHLLCGVHVGA